MLRLKRYDFNLPGGYKYVQPETGMKFDGNTPFKAQVVQISVHRKGNNLPRQSRAEVAVDLENYTCARVPGVCIDGVKQSTVVSVVTRKGGCRTCGGRKK
jgi:hypothetical protein